MEKYKLHNDVKVFGTQVRRLPPGIKEAFDSLIKILPDGLNRSYYGIGEFDKAGSILYYTSAQETFDGEAEKTS